MVLFTFTDPFYLFFLFAIPLLILVHFFALRNSKGYALKFANFEAIAKIKGIDIYSKNIVTLVLAVLIMCLVILSLSGLRLHMSLPSTDISYVIAIDSSQSMSATDISPNRFTAAKNLATDFVDNLNSGARVGVVSFSGSSLIQQTITDNKNEIKSKINSLQFSQVSGTNLYDAVVTSTNLLQNEKFKGIILISDGQINVGNIQKAVQYAQDHDVVVNTIGIGTEQGGETSYGLSKVDTDSLKGLAFNTKGKFFLASNSTALKNAFNQIITLKTGIVGIDVSNYLLIGALVLFFIYFVLGNTRYRTFP